MIHKSNQLDAYSTEQLEGWIGMHFRSSVILSALISVLEIAGFFVFDALGEIQTSTTRYFLKYWVLPTSACFGTILISYVLLRRMRNPAKKSLAVSLMLTFIVFIIYTVHKEFSIMDVGFAVAIAITIIYSNRSVTTATFVFAAVLKAVSDVFFIRDYRYSPDISSMRMSPYVDFSMSFVGLALCYIVILLIERIEQEKRYSLLQSKRESIYARRESLVDSLTGIYNRKALTAELNRLDVEYDGAYSLVMIDLDDFKSVNDMHGHHTGDVYLANLGQMLAKVGDAKVYRYGGDEFCIVFFHDDEDRLLDTCRKLSNDFSECVVNKNIHRTTLSYGVAVSDDKRKAADILKRADLALYQAKKSKDSIVFGNGRDDDN